MYRTIVAKISALLQKFLVALLLLYRYCVSPFLGQRCRFYPSCSAYSLEAITEHGSFKGCWLTLRRLLKCHPWHPGGVDLVPEKMSHHER